MKMPSEDQIASAEAAVEALEKALIGFMAKRGDHPSVSLPALVACAGWSIAWLVTAGKNRDLLLAVVGEMLMESVDSASAALADEALIAQAASELAAAEAEKETKH